MSLAEQLVMDDFLWSVIQQYLPSDSKRDSRKVDVRFNCPMCVARGERRPDRYHRCGLKRNPDGVGVNCFNCQLRLRWSYGEALNSAWKDFLEYLGVPSLEVRRLAHKSHALKRIAQGSPTLSVIGDKPFEPYFREEALPYGARPISDWLNEGCEDPRFLDTLSYLASRGETLAVSWNYYWTPEEGKYNFDRRLIIPFLFKDKIVGWTCRAIDDGVDPKYFMIQPEDYLFNNELIATRGRKFIFVVEGPLDAIAIDGVATLGSKLNDRQANWINSSGKIPILIADRDSSGNRHIDLALKHGWHISFPRLRSTGWWDEDVKDCAEAVRRYGRLFTVRSIIENATSDKVKIAVWRKLLV